MHEKHAISRCSQARVAAPQFEVADGDGTVTGRVGGAVAGAVVGGPVGGIVRLNSILPARAPGWAGAALFLLTNCRRTRKDFYCENGLYLFALTVPAGGFIAQQRNLVLVGGTGTGKTHLAIAIARSCIRAGSRGRAFFTTVDLVNQLEAQARAGRQGRLADYLTRLDFVILDEVSRVGITCEETWPISFALS